MNRRIILVSGSAPPDACGVGDYTESLASALQRAGLRAEVFCNRDWTVRGTSGAARKLLVAGDSLVHLQYPTMGYGHSLGPQFCSLVTPCVVTIHEFTLAHPLRKLSLLPFTFRARRLVMTSEFERRSLLRRMPWVSGRIGMIPIGTNIPSVQTPSGERLRSVVSFGLVMPGKGLEEFIEFARLVRAKGLTWDLLVIGKVAPGRAEYAKHLMSLSQPLGVQWVLDRAATEVGELLSRSGLGYFPYPDGASERRGSLKAALTSGLPCITTRTEQTPTQVAAAVEFASTPAEALATALRLMDNRSEMERLSRAATEYSQQFTWEKIADAHVQMYCELEAGSRDAALKKVYINGKFFCQQVTGTQRYARELLNQFDRLLSAENAPTVEMEVLVPRGAFSVPRYTNLKVRTVGWLRGTQWEQIELPWFSRGEVLLTLSGGAPILHSRNVITIHDAAVFAAPGAYSRSYRLWYRNLYRTVAQSAEHVFTVSNFSKSEIVKWCGTDPRKISVTYLGSEHLSSLEADRTALARFGIQGKYVLAVSSQNPNKNLHRLVEAISGLNLAGQEAIGVVIVGGFDRRVFRRGLKLPDEVRVLGYVSDAELKALYEGAACFVFASLYEGFGLPPLEAVSCGCPIVVSRAASLPELFEGVAVFCDPSSSSDISAAVRRALQMVPVSREELKSQARKFQWEKCARETLAVLCR